MGIDPVTHKPKSAALSSAVGGDSKVVANLSHTAQWESARLEAEARLVRSSKLRQHQIGSISASAPAQAQLLGKITSPRAPPRCLDVITARQGGGVACGGGFGIGGCSIDSPTSTLTFSENAPAVSTVGSSVISRFTDACEGEVCEEDDDKWRGFQRESLFPEYGNCVDITRHIGDDAMDLEVSGSNVGDGNFIEGFTNLLLGNRSDELEFSGEVKITGDGTVAGGEWEEAVEIFDGGLIEENKNYWNDILDLMNCGSSDPPVF